MEGSDPVKHLHGGRNVTRKEKGGGGEGRGEKSNGGGGFSGNSRKRTRGKGIIPRVSKERVSNYRRIALHSVRRAWLAPSKSNSFRTLGCRTPPPPLNRPPSPSARSFRFVFPTPDPFPLHGWLSACPLFPLIILSLNFPPPWAYPSPRMNGLNGLSSFRG